MMGVEAQLSPDRELDEVLGGFESASSELMRARSLQHRVERKFLLPRALVQPLLAGLHGDFSVVMSAGFPFGGYETIYFDTVERLFYNEHRRGRRPRYKVRIRHHRTRGATFLEVKCKERNDRTTKARVELPYGRSELDTEGRRFVDAHCPVGAERLVSCVAVKYFRATLLSAVINERVTLDWNLELRSHDATERVPGVVIAEIKQARRSDADGAVRVMKALNIREQRVSKYCLGIARLTPVRLNTFKPALRALERLSRCQS